MEGCHGGVPGKGGPLGGPPKGHHSWRAVLLQPQHKKKKGPIEGSPGGVSEFWSLALPGSKFRVVLAVLGAECLGIILYISIVIMAPARGAQGFLIPHTRGWSNIPNQ